MPKTTPVTIAYFEKPIPPHGYLAGVRAATNDADGLIAEFEGLYKDRPEVQRATHGFTDIRTKEIAQGGDTVGGVEAHHNKDLLTVYTTHREAQKLIEIALRRGYMPLDGPAQG